MKDKLPKLIKQILDSEIPLWVKSVFVLSVALVAFRQAGLPVADYVESGAHEVLSRFPFLKDFLVGLLVGVGFGKLIRFLQNVTMRHIQYRYGADVAKQASGTVHTLGFVLLNFFVVLAIWSYLETFK